ncbi:MAG: CoA-binding protein [Ignavibacteriaceae bacterium]
METKEFIEKFFESGNIAIIGASENKQKFGCRILGELKKRGFNIYPVNPKKEFILGDKCFNSVKALPGYVEDALVVIPPVEANKVAREVISTGIKRLWFQQGSESEEAINFCCQNNIDVIEKKCILMYAPPVKGFHKFHRGIWRIIGKL